MRAAWSGHPPEMKNEGLDAELMVEKVCKFQLPRGGGGGVKDVLEELSGLYSSAAKSSKTGLPFSFLQS